MNEKEETYNPFHDNSNDEVGGWLLKKDKDRMYNQSLFASCHALAFSLFYKHNVYYYLLKKL